VTRIFAVRTFPLVTNLSRRNGFRLRPSPPRSPQARPGPARPGWMMF